jgi:hypothetical protein
MDWVCAAVARVNSNAGVVTALATVVIAYASWISSRIIRLEKKIERANRMPVLAFVEEHTRGNSSVVVKNAGYGPALNIVCKVIVPGKLLCATPNEALTIGALAPTEQAFAYMGLLFADAHVLDDPKFHAVIECDDILDGHYESTYRDRTLFGPVRIVKRKMPPSQARRI